MRRLLSYFTVLTTIAAAGVVLPAIFNTDRIYTHFFYIAIALTTIWYPRYSILVGFLLGIEHLIVEFVLHGAFNRITVIRSVLIIFISVMLSKIWGTQQKYRMQIERLSYESQHDSMTKLFNRAYFDSCFQRELSVPIAIFICDMDNLKITNDSYGHATGDILIIQMAEFLSAFFKSEDILARLGGDEFGILIQNCSQEDAENLIIEMREALRVLNKDREEHLQILFSIGFSICENRNCLYETKKQADRAMYLEKILKKKTL